MNEQAIPFGERRSDGRIVTASEVPRGDACDCICPECGGSLQAHHGDVLRWHFQHKADTTRCSGGPESALHKFAKQIIAEKQAIWIPPLMARFTSAKAETRSLTACAGRWVKLRNVRQETRITPLVGDFIVPDIVAEMSARTRDNRIVHSEVLIEIVVSHPATEKKKQLLAAEKLNSFEIYLSGLLSRHRPTLYDCTADVLRDAPRGWLWNGKQDEINAAYDAALRAHETVRLKHLERIRRMRWRDAEHRRFYKEMLEARNAIIEEAKPNIDWAVASQRFELQNEKTRRLQHQVEWTEKWYGKYAADKLRAWVADWQERSMPEIEAAE